MRPDGSLWSFWPGGSATSAGVAQQVQLRPMALPPKAYEVQLGRTLKFIIDQFIVCPQGKKTTAQPR